MEEKNLAEEVYVTLNQKQLMIDVVKSLLSLELLAKICFDVFSSWAEKNKGTELIKIPTSWDEVVSENSQIKGLFVELSEKMSNEAICTVIDFLLSLEDGDMIDELINKLEE